MNQYRKTPRASFLDYESGDYFITICTHNRVHYFGEIVNGEMQLSEIGKFVDLQLRNATYMRSSIEIPLYVVMPNHIHFIISLKSERDSGIKPGNVARCPNPMLRSDPQTEPQKPELSRYISSLKGSVTKFAKANNFSFAWHGRYHDHKIRRLKDGNLIAEYILSNVLRWDSDCFR